MMFLVVILFMVVVAVLFNVIAPIYGAYCVARMLEEEKTKKNRSVE